MNFPRKNLIIFFILFTLAGVLSGYFVLDYLARVRLPQVLGDRVQITDFTYSLWNRSVRFNRPSFLSDSIQHESSVHIDAKASQAFISGFNLWDLLRNQEISVDTLTMDDLQVKIQLPRIQASLQEKQEINLFIKEIFNRISVDHFKLSSASFDVQQRDEQPIATIKGLSIVADEIAIDTATIQHVFPLTFGRYEVGIDSVEVRLDEDYQLTGKKILVKDTSFQVENLQLRPVISRLEFAQKYPYEKVQFDVQLKHLMGHQILWNIAQNGQVRISSTKVVCDQPEIRIFKDKRLPSPPLLVKPLLGRLIKDLPFGIRLDTLIFRKGVITYEQQPVDFPKSGKVHFEKFYMTAYHLSNEPGYLVDHPEAIMDVQCEFLGQTTLYTTIKLNLSSEDDRFEVAGELGALSMTHVNQVLAPLRGVKATGEIYQLKFQLSGDNYSTSGELNIDYDHLKIQVFDEKRNEEWLKSVFGNLALNGKNLQSAGSDYKTGEIYFIRYRNKGFFNYLWNSLRVGLMEVAVPLYQNPDKTNDRQGPKMKLD